MMLQLIRVSFLMVLNLLLLAHLKLTILMD
nr:MAG TPA: hypothetical protein [Caudoviricetes sp.]